MDVFPNSQDLIVSFRKIDDGKTSIISGVQPIANDSSVLLPHSIIGRIEEASVARLFFSYYDSGVMFPLEKNRSDVGVGVKVSAVVAASFSGEKLYDLPDDVIITINLGTDNYTNVTCVSWDFDANGRDLLFLCNIQPQEFYYYFNKLQMDKEAGLKKAVS